MPRLPNPILDERVSSRTEHVPFSYWPTTRTLGRWKVQTKQYATDPWRSIETAIRSITQSKSRKGPALNFLSQASDFFAAARSAKTHASRPILYYYSFLNLAKVLIAINTKNQFVGPMYHGMSDTHSYDPNRSSVDLYPSTTNRLNLLDELQKALHIQPFHKNETMGLQALYGTSLFGHRDWSHNARRKERFLAAEIVEFVQNRHKKVVGARFRIRRSKWSRLNRSQQEIIQESGLANVMRFVETKFDDYDQGNPDEYLTLETASPVQYVSRPIDRLHKIVEPLRNLLWRSIETAEPFHRYYLYLCPPSEYRLTQLTSIYALMYKLSSTARYHPTVLQGALKGRYGGFLNEFLSTYPNQFVYSVACECMKQEVISRPVI